MDPNPLAQTPFAALTFPSVNVKENASGHLQPDAAATEQFTIADTRSPAEIADTVHALGYEPVWKDWDSVLTATN